MDAVAFLTLGRRAGSALRGCLPARECSFRRRGEMRFASAWNFARARARASAEKHS
jgi:hypothetical protein